MNVEMVRPGLYAIMVPGSNSIAARVTNEGVILVDDMVIGNYDGIIEKLKTITDKPVKYIINTHHHADHTGTNPRFAASMQPQIFGHKNARKNMIGDSATPPQGVIFVTFTDEGSIHLGGAEVRMHYFGRGHTDGDTVVYFPDLRAVHTGDLFVVLDRPPSTDFAAGGTTLIWKQTLRNMLNKLDFDVVIPGHGPVATRTDVERFITRLDTLHTRVIELIRKKVPKDQIVSQVKLDDLNWVSTATGKTDPNSLWARGFSGFYDELAGSIK
jgi:glyoxylase-like metal-dependent hydrolase (beta-lactamase superfamily II)